MGQGHGRVAAGGKVVHIGGMKQTFLAMRDFGLAVWGRIGAGHFGLIAAGVAFYAMFAVFPGLAASVAIWSLVADPAVMGDYLEVSREFLPDGAWALVNNQVMILLSARKATLGWATVFSTLVALYSARAGVSALISGLEFVHRSDPRPFLWGLTIDLMVTGALVLALFSGFTTSIAVPIILDYVELGLVGEWLLAVLPRMAMFLVVVSCLAILYRFGPRRTARGMAPKVWLGVLVAAVAWALVSYAFSAYLANFNSYNKIYGAIGAVAALMMWLYLSVWAVLLGGAINAELTAKAQTVSDRDGLRVT